MIFFAQQFINGLTIGSQYALWAVGFGLVYQVLGIYNFSHGDAVLLPVLVALSLLVAGVPFPAAAIIAVVLGAAISIVLERLTARPFIRRKMHFLAMVGPLAGAIILRNIDTLAWGSAAHPFPGVLPHVTVNLGGVLLQSSALANVAIAAIVVIAFQLYLTKTRTGQGILGLAQDRDTAALMGIPVDRTVAIVYGLSGAVGVIGALMFVENVQVINIGMGFAITLKAFVAAVIGGISSIQGAIVGGLCLGLLQALIVGYVNTQWTDAVVYTTMACFLLLRPKGIIGRSLTTKL
jgi:branched-chain amino acid transport system permease protein